MLARYVPALTWLRTYQRDNFKSDFSAGLTVAIMLVPQGMAYAMLRRRFGPEIALIGGIDAGALAQDAAAVREAVSQTVPALLEGGRCLPCLDDRPRSNVPFRQYRLYRHLLEKIAGSR